MKPTRKGRFGRRIGSAARITEERILKISNDISEDMCTASRAEIMAVAKYWGDVAAKTSIDLAALKSKLVVGLVSLWDEVRRFPPNTPTQPRQEEDALSPNATTNAPLDKQS